MGGGRVEGLIGLLGILLVVAAVLLGVVRFARIRGRRNPALDDVGDMFEDVGEDTGPEGGPPRFADFAEALDQYVVPLHEAHPDWDRLDGANGIPGRAAFHFERNAIRFEVNGETRFAPLLAARTWLADHPGEDPL